MSMTVEKQKNYTRRLIRQKEKASKELEMAKESWTPRNIGYAFVICRDLRHVGQFIKQGKYGKIKIQKEFESRWPEIYRKKLQFENWVFAKAFHWNDINWEELNPKPLSSFRKKFVSSFVLVLLSFFLVTPLFIYKHILDDSNPLLRIIQVYLPLITLVLVNVVIIPFFVDVAAALMDNETKSSMQTKIMYMNMILMHLNMIILPLTGLVTYEQLIFLYQNNSTGRII